MCIRDRRNGIAALGMNVDDSASDNNVADLVWSLVVAVAILSLATVAFLFKNRPSLLKNMMRKRRIRVQDKVRSTRYK